MPKLKSSSGRPSAGKESIQLNPYPQDGNAYPLGEDERKIKGEVVFVSSEKGFFLVRFRIGLREYDVFVPQKAHFIRQGNFLPNKGDVARGTLIFILRGGEVYPQLERVRTKTVKQQEAMLEKPRYAEVS